MESVQQRVHVHQARDGLEEPMTGQRREASAWAVDPRPGPEHWGRGSAGQPGMGERRPRGPVNKAREGEAMRGRGRRERVRGAGAREAPPLTITIDAPRIMKIMVFALMDIGRGRAGPERRPPAPAPPRPRPDAEPPPPPQRSARRAPTAAGRGGGAGPARGRGRGAPGVLGRPARALAAPAALRSALGPASRPARGAAPAPSSCGLPRARLPGGTSPPAAARPRDAGRTPPRGPQGPLAPMWPGPALAASPEPRDRGPRPVPTRQGYPVEARASFRSPPHFSAGGPSSPQPGVAGLRGCRPAGRHPAHYGKRLPLVEGLQGGCQLDHSRAMATWPNDRGQKRPKNPPLRGAEPASASALFRGRPGRSEA